MENIGETIGTPVNASMSDTAETGYVSRTAEILMGIDLPVRILFGSTRVRLKDLLALKSGSVIELDRPVEGNVDIVVNNRVVARGEVIVVDGNYGVRVKEIVNASKPEMSTATDLMHMLRRMS